MNAKLWIAALALAFPLITTAQDSAVQLDTSPKPRLDWTLDPIYWDALIAQEPDLRIRLRGGVMMGGLLIEGARLRQYEPDATFGQRLLNFPVIRLFVPQPMPSPPGTGRYFAWGERRQPWTTVASSGAARAGYNPAAHEPVASLVSFSW